MKLVLSRHADKKNEIHSDPELDALGKIKAKRLPQVIGSKDLPRPDHVWSSPKVRAVQTFEPLTEDLGLSMQVTDLLAESKPKESAAEFETRIENFVAKIAQNPDQVHFACSHYDWVIRFCERSLGNRFEQYPFCLHWKPCQYIVFEIETLGDGFPVWKTELLGHGVID